MGPPISLGMGTKGSKFRLSKSFFWFMIILARNVDTRYYVCYLLIGSSAYIDWWMVSVIATYWTLFSLWDEASQPVLYMMETFFLLPPMSCFISYVHD
jgi:hypothetical protein